MGTWTEALEAARGRATDIESMTEILAPATVLAAALLDWQGSRPEFILEGTVMLVAPSAHLREGIEDLLLAVYGDDACMSPAALRRGGIYVVRSPKSTAGWALTVSRLGCPAILLAADPAEVVAPSTLAAVDDTLFLVPGIPREVVIATALGVTGQRVHVDHDMPSLSVEEVLSVIHAGDTGGDAERRIGDLVHAKRVATEAAADAESKSRRKPGAKAAVATGPTVRRLAEMSGFGEASAWGLQLAEDLRAYRAGTLPWADVDRGILLSGPPGSGKTTFAAALALECEVELVTTTYTEWSAAGGSVGDTMSKGMTKLYDQWRAKAAKAPFVLFIDEIDTMGRRGGNDHNESWFTSVINSWLAFLDGAVPRDGIVVVAATNHAERVDPALLRPGRLDRHVVLPYPGVEALAAVVRLHLGPGADCPEDDLRRAARACRGMSPAAVAQVCREARRTARRTLKRKVAAADIVLVLAAQRLEALQRPGAREMDRRVAIHEAGHALAILESGTEVLGHVDLDDAMTWAKGLAVLTLAQAEARLTVLLAGLAAEQVLLGAHSSGVGIDLREATSLAATCHARWGMGVLGYRVEPAGDVMADDLVRLAVDAILDAAHARATALVEGSRAAVERLAARLQRDRYLDAEEVRAALAETAPDPRDPGHRRVRTIGTRRVPPGI